MELSLLTGKSGKIKHVKLNNILQNGSSKNKEKRLVNTLRVTITDGAARSPPGCWVLGTGQHSLCLYFDREQFSHHTCEGL